MPNNLENYERSTENSNVNISQNLFPDPLVGDTQCQIHTIVLYDIYKKEKEKERQKQKQKQKQKKKQKKKRKRKQKQKQKEIEKRKEIENKNYKNDCMFLTSAKSPEIDQNGKISSEKLCIKKALEEIIKKLKKPNNGKISNRGIRSSFAIAKQNISEKDIKFLKDKNENLTKNHLIKFFLKKENSIYIKSDRRRLYAIPCYLSFLFFVNYILKNNVLLIIHLTRFSTKINKATDELKVSVKPNDCANTSNNYEEFTLFYRYQPPDLSEEANQPEKKLHFLGLLEETPELKNEMAIVIAIHSYLIKKLPEITSSCFYESDSDKFIEQFKKLDICTLLGVIGAAHRQIPRSAEGPGVEECSKIFNQEKIFEISDSKFNNAEYDNDAYFKKTGGFEGTKESYNTNLTVAYKYGIFRFDPEKQNEEIKIKKETCLHAKHIYLATGNTINSSY